MKEIHVENVTADDVLNPLKEGAELYTNLTENFISEFVFYRFNGI